jgi:hypothetical protein
MKTSKFLLPWALCFFANFPVYSQTKKLTAAEAKDHVGERAMVCGQVVSTRYADKSKGQPTFLNLDKPYPNDIFTILIWGSNRSKFGEPEKTYQDKPVCATGVIRSYRGTPEIEASEASQIEIQN